jgi:hypothetical protein
MMMMMMMMIRDRILMACWIPAGADNIAVSVLLVQMCTA